MSSRLRVTQNIPPLPPGMTGRCQRSGLSGSYPQQLIGTDFFPLFKQDLAQCRFSGVPGGHPHSQDVAPSWASPPPDAVREPQGPQTPAPAPRYTRRGLLRQQQALFNRYLTHLALPRCPPLPTCRAEGTAFMRVGFCSRQIYGHPWLPALDSSLGTGGFAKLGSGADSSFPRLPSAKVQGEWMKRSYMKKTTLRHHSRYEIFGGLGIFVVFCFVSRFGFVCFGGFFVWIILFFF